MVPEKAVVGFTAAVNKIIAIIPHPKRGLDVFKHSFLCRFVFMIRFSMYMADVIKKM
jgi:hypothetical protein